MAAVAPQLFICSLAQDFGAWVFASTTNVRQVVSTIVSYITYHHHITLLLVVGLATVFLRHSAPPKKSANATAVGTADDGAYSATEDSKASAV